MLKYGVSFIVVLSFLAVVVQADEITLVNGGFEDDSVVYPDGAAGWPFIQYSGSTPASGVMDVTGSASWQADTPDGSSKVCFLGCRYSSAMQQAVSHDWVAGDTYKVSFDFLSRSSAWTSFGVLLGSNQDGGSTNVRLFEAFDNAVVPEYQWRSYSFDYVADDSVIGQNGLVVRFVFTGNGGSAMLDNVHVSHVPEPATMTLLSLGGLAVSLGRRRRRAAK